MARIRTIKPEFWTDEKIVELDYVDRLLFIGLWNFADDQGYLPFQPKRIKMQVFPGDPLEVSRGLQRLHELGLIRLYATKSGIVIHCRHWERHQKVSNPSKPKYTAADLRLLDSFPESSRGLCTSLESYPAEKEGKGREVEGKGTTTSSETDDATNEPDSDADVLCDHLASRIEANGSKRPVITRKWRQAARLMVEKDGRTPEQIRKAIDWCQDDEFWRSNVMSMPKLREKFDVLRLQAQRSARAPTGRTGTDDRVRGHLALARTLAQRESGNTALEIDQ